MSSKRHESKQPSSVSSRPDKESVQLSDEIKSDEKPIRICIYGEKGVGKTTFKNKLIAAKKNDNSENGVFDFTITEVEMNPIVIPSTETTASHFKAKNSLHLHAEIIFILFDLSDKLDAKIVKKSVKEVMNNNLRSVIKLIGTKADNEHPENKKLNKNLSENYKIRCKMSNKTPLQELATLLNGLRTTAHDNKLITNKLDINGL